MTLCSGYEFMKTADICIDSNRSANNILKKDIKHIMYIENYSKEDILKLHTAKIIFFPTNQIRQVFHKFYKFFKENVIIITHNSDHHIHNTNDVQKLYINCIDYLNLPKIKYWFAQNTLIKHNKLIAIPIGIANPQWVHGNINKLTEIKKKNNKKINLLFINFDRGTRNKYKYRKPVLDILKNKGYNTNFQKEHQEQYWEKLSKSKFCISPHGNGVDCHRIWEAIFLNTIPIVLKNSACDSFKNLPILFINSWEEISDNFLKAKSIEFNKNFNRDMIYIEYYKFNFEL